MPRLLFARAVRERMARTPAHIGVANGDLARRGLRAPRLAGSGGDAASCAPPGGQRRCARPPHRLRSEGPSDRRSARGSRARASGRSPLPGQLAGGIARLSQGRCSCNSDPGPAGRSFASGRTRASGRSCTAPRGPSTAGAVATSSCRCHSRCLLAIWAIVRDWSLARRGRRERELEGAPIAEPHCLSPRSISYGARAARSLGRPTTRRASSPARSRAGPGSIQLTHPSCG